ncbi:hypothetical protein [Dyella sp.]|uniref:hypothetical protein n=1 Tax=Dyella sp. TaxID=1869338 RepID=UPI002ED61AE4
MNEFEWHRQMRTLREPVAPQRDLWTQIDAALDAARPEASTPSARRRPRAWLLAASVAGLALLAGGLAFQWQREQAQVPTTVANTTPSSTPSDVTRWKPNDPRLAGAAVELDAAQMELRQALKQAPDSVALQRLLDRTEQQQAQLRHMENQAS